MRRDFICNFSETNGWTNFKTPVEINQTSICIKVDAQYLPDGKEDEFEIQVGTMLSNTEAELVSISLWKSNGCVFVSHPAVQTVEKQIQSEASLMDIEIDIPSGYQFLR